MESDKVEEQKTSLIKCKKPHPSWTDVYAPIIVCDPAVCSDVLDWCIALVCHNGRDFVWIRITRSKYLRQRSYRISYWNAFLVSSTAQNQE